MNLSGLIIVYFDRNDPDETFQAANITKGTYSYWGSDLEKVIDGIDANSNMKNPHIVTEGDYPIFLYLADGLIVTKEQAQQMFPEYFL